MWVFAVLSAKVVYRVIPLQNHRAACHEEERKLHFLICLASHFFVPRQFGAGHIPPIERALTRVVAMTGGIAFTQERKLRPISSRQKHLQKRNYNQNLKTRRFPKKPCCCSTNLQGHTVA